MILSPQRDPRLITIRRGGMLTDHDHHLRARGIPVQDRRRHGRACPRRGRAEWDLAEAVMIMRSVSQMAPQRPAGPSLGVVGRWSAIWDTSPEDLDATALEV
ncbi:hypothetical protein GIY30_22575 [Gordonia sp. HNM0687]|uniref:Uncharacterized protein n=1 Tax=Gordonia mangrovi TaxID=2665643 RepID=A0A6L7GZ03_9ACTN|nr:hypothetical protein [Gordonia mangrovi]MXP24128.1 hypothetical protein [Gordonia mangrovi]UVF78070.1 hypothetical protein NWF22_23080 [Gordonia mangrovi]